MTKIYSWAFSQECSIQTSDRSKLTSELTVVCGMSQGGNNVLDKMLITGGWWWTSPWFSKVAEKGERNKPLSCFSSTTDTTS